MKLSTSAFFATILAAAANAQFMIVTPGNVVECEPSLLSWSGGVPPYFLAIVDGNAPTTTLENLGQVNGTSISWTVNFASGTTLGLNLKDNTGATAQSGSFPVQAGTSTACVGQGVQTSAGPTSSGASTTGTTASTTGSSGSTTASTGTQSTSQSSGTSTSPSSATTSSAAGRGQIADLGVVGILGAVVAAIMA